jgi:hypothetical protein
MKQTNEFDKCISFTEIGNWYALDNCEGNINIRAFNWFMFYSTDFIIYHNNISKGNVRNPAVRKYKEALISF